MRELLKLYFASFSGTPFGDPNPEHFLDYCLAAVRSRGHGTLSYLSRRKIESIFEEHVQELLSEEHVKVAENDVLVDT